MVRRTRLLTVLSLAALLCAVFFVVAAPAYAQINAGLEPVRQTIALGTQDIRVIVARVIQAALGLVGIVIVVLIIYAGWNWMTAGGNEEKIATAKRTLTSALIGLAIILSAFAIAQFVITRLVGATGDGSLAGIEGRVTSRFGDFGTGSLGEGIVQSHYPPPGGTDIPRNTKIIITFKAPMDPASIISGGNINPANIRILQTRSIATGGVAATAADQFITNVAAVSTDNRNFVFIPNALLGSPTERVSYTVSLTGGASGIRRADGTPAFDGAFGGGYRWEFETSTSIDTTPPTVVSVYPRADGQSLPRNTIIQINFNEAIDPVTSAGAIPPFTNVRVTAGGQPVPGSWEIGNQYRTIEFRSAERAGTNSCGADVFVLPANVTLLIAASAASLGAEPPSASLPYPFDGVTDVAGNSLDGNGNRTAEGAPADSYSWRFGTSAEIDLTPPRVATVSPAVDAGGANLTAPVGITFSKPMSVTTLNNANIRFSSRPSLPLWYYGEAVNLTSGDVPITQPSDPLVRTRADIVHEALAPSVGICSGGVRSGKDCAVLADCAGGTCVVQRFDYYPDVTSGVTDLNQNCFFPTCGQDPTRPYCCPNASAGEVSCSVPCVANGGGALSCPR